MSVRPSPTVLALFLSGCLAQPEPLDDGGASDAALAPGEDASTRPGSDDAAVVVGTGPYCAISAILVPRCTACHRTGGTPPDLSFEGGRSLAGAASTLYAGKTLVVPGDAEASLLFRKIRGAPPAGEGAQMPIGAPLAASEIALVEAWIEARASSECDTAPSGDAGVVRYHPEGFALPEPHGRALTTGALDCRTCHGATLEGGAAPSCDSCHAQGWRTNCVFCHGGVDTMTGAPPRGLRGERTRDEQTFRPHREHGSVMNHAAYDCTECHLKPTDVLSLGHVFDDSPGQADVTFEHGLSAGGRYDGSGGCSSLYCHGSGQAPDGTAQHDVAPGSLTCTTCHAGQSSNRSAWGRMSGAHQKHLEEGVRCIECHAATLSSNTSIGDPALHVNGVKDIAFSVPGMTRNAAGRCSGDCHGEQHDRNDWLDDDD